MVNVRLVQLSTLFPYTTLFRSGAWRSTVTEAGDPATAVWALPATSLTEKLDARVRLLVPVLPDVIEDVAEIVQVVVDRKITGLNSSNRSKSYSVLCLVEIVAQS